MNIMVIKKSIKIYTQRHAPYVTYNDKRYLYKSTTIHGVMITSVQSLVSNKHT